MLTGLECVTSKLNVLSKKIWQKGYFSAGKILDGNGYGKNNHQTFHTKKPNTLRPSSDV